MELKSFEWYYPFFYNLVYFPPILQVLKNELKHGFQYDTEALVRVNDINTIPETYVSSWNTFSFHSVTNRSEGPEKFKARVKKGKKNSGRPVDL